MIDLQIKGNGDSRYLKSSVPAGTTWEQALEMLTAGTFPIDLNGINPSGIQTMGDPLNKATLLPDSVVTLLGIVAQNPLIKDALTALHNQTVDGLALKADLASPALTGMPTAPTAANGTNTTQVATTAFVQDAITNHSPNLPRMEIGGYQGSETYGAGHETALHFTFDPRIVFISSVRETTTNNGKGFGIYHREYDKRGSFISFVSDPIISRYYAYSVASTYYINASTEKYISAHTLKWYSTDSAQVQLNNSGINYTWAAIG